MQSLGWTEACCSRQSDGAVDPDVAGCDPLIEVVMEGIAASDSRTSAMRIKIFTASRWYLCGKTGKWRQ